MYELRFSGEPNPEDLTMCETFGLDGNIHGRVGDLYPEDLPLFLAMNHHNRVSIYEGGITLTFMKRTL